jgi:hypothetical protein
MSLSTMAQKASRFLEFCVCVQNAGLQKQNAHKLTVKAVRLATAGMNEIELELRLLQSAR